MAPPSFSVTIEAARFWFSDRSIRLLAGIDTSLSPTRTVYGLVLTHMPLLHKHSGPHPWRKAVGFLCVKPSPGLSCLGPWTPGG